MRDRSGTTGRIKRDSLSLQRDSVGQGAGVSGTDTETMSGTSVSHSLENLIIRHAWRDRVEPATIHYLAIINGSCTKLSTNAGEPLHLRLADVLDVAAHPYQLSDQPALAGVG